MTADWKILGVALLWCLLGVGCGGTQNSPVAMVEGEGVTVDGNLVIQSQADVQANQDVVNVRGKLIVKNGPMTDLVLPQLKTVGGDLRIQKVAGLETIELTALQAVGGHVWITQNPNLLSIDHMEHLTAIHADLRIQGNPMLERVASFKKLKTIEGNISIDNNASLTELSGFPRLTSLGGGLTVTKNASLKRLLGFQKLNRIGHDFQVINNAQLGLFEGFDTLRVIDSHLKVRANRQLESLPSFSALRSIGGNVEVLGNTGICQSYLQHFDQQLLSQIVVTGTKQVFDGRACL